MLTWKCLRRNPNCATIKYLESRRSCWNSQSLKHTRRFSKTKTENVRILAVPKYSSLRKSTSKFGVLSWVVSPLFVSSDQLLGAVSYSSWRPYGYRWWCNNDNLKRFCFCRFNGKIWGLKSLKSYPGKACASSMNTRLVYSHHISFFRVFLLTLHVDARVSQAGYIPVPGIIGINLGDTTLCRRRKRSVLAARWKVCCMEPLRPLLPELFLLFLLLLLILLLILIIPFSRLPWM